MKQLLLDVDFFQQRDAFAFHSLSIARSTDPLSGMRVPNSFVRELLKCLPNVFVNTSIGNKNNEEAVNTKLKSEVRERWL